MERGYDSCFSPSPMILNLFHILTLTGRKVNNKILNKDVVTAIDSCYNYNKNFCRFGGIMNGKKVKIIGYGNPFRRDDAIGIWIVSRLKYIWKPPEEKVEFWMGQQLVPEIAEWIKDADEVVFIDSSLKTAATEGWEFIRLSPEKSRFSDNMFHSVDISDILSLVKREYGVLPSAWLLAVTGYDFSFGAGLTERAKRAAEKAIGFIMERYRCIR